jgi:hypothetical protein
MDGWVMWRSNNQFNNSMGFIYSNQFSFDHVVTRMSDQTSSITAIFLKLKLELSILVIHPPSSKLHLPGLAQRPFSSGPHPAQPLPTGEAVHYRANTEPAESSVVDCV